MRLGRCAYNKEIEMPNPAPLWREQNRWTGTTAPCDSGVTLEKLLHVSAFCEAQTKPRHVSALELSHGKIGRAAAVCGLSHTRSVVQ